MPTTGTNGIVVGVVDRLDDPSALGRVLVTYPHLDDTSSTWAPIASAMASGGYGSFFRPSPGDQVLVAFEHGDPRAPYVIGSLWSATKRPPDAGPAPANNKRFIRSRSGHTILLDDTAGAEKVEIVDKDGTRKITIDSSGHKLLIVCGAGDIELRASGTVKVDAATVAIESMGNTTIRAGGVLTLAGTQVIIN